MSDTPADRSKDARPLSKEEAMAMRGPAIIRSPSALFVTGACRLCGFKTDAVGRGRTGARNSHYAKHLRAGELLRKAPPMAERTDTERLNWLESTIDDATTAEFDTTLWRCWDDASEQRSPTFVVESSFAGKGEGSSLREAIDRAMDAQEAPDA